MALQPLFVLQALVFLRWVDRRPTSDLPLGFGRLARQVAVLGTLLSLVLMGAYVGLTALFGVTVWQWNADFLPAATFLTALMAASAGLGEEFLCVQRTDLPSLVGQCGDSPLCL